MTVLKFTRRPRVTSRAQRSTWADRSGPLSRSLARPALLEHLPKSPRLKYRRSQTGPTIDIVNPRVDNVFMESRKLLAQQISELATLAKELKPTGATLADFDTLAELDAL